MRSSVDNSALLRRYVCIPETGALVHKPVNVTIEQAAAVPVAAITALQAARDHGHMQPGQKVLVNGASGAWVALPCRLPGHSEGR
jgi:NADPH:quinone reductase-like Zn-dependent oxidoreductase